MPNEPSYGDFIYEEIRQCEEYALLNMVTFEATIRNSKVKQMLGVLDAKGSEGMLDAMLKEDNHLKACKRLLKGKYLLDYNAYAEYRRERDRFFAEISVGDIEYDTVEDAEAEAMDQISLSRVRQYKKYSIIVNHDNHNAHTHYLSLPFYRPKAYVPQKHSIIDIQVPVYLIHPQGIKDYYQRLGGKHLETMQDAQFYYELEELFFDTTDKKKSKAAKYAEMFFAWDYVQWWEQNQKPKQKDRDKDESYNFTTRRSLYAEIAEMIDKSEKNTGRRTTNEGTGRNATVEKNMEIATRLIEKCGYKEFYGQGFVRLSGCLRRSN